MTPLDLFAFLAYLVGITVLGLVLPRRRPGADVFLAGRVMGWFPIGLSVMITLFSAVNLVAFPTEVMEHGLYVLASLPVFILVAIPITRVFIPFFHRMNLTSLYAYLEQRFDRRVCRLAGGLFILWRLFWMAIALHASARILGPIAGLPYPALILGAGAIAALYTALGGIRTVMWTDVLQALVLLAGILGALGVAWAAQDQGWAGLWAQAEAGGQLRPFRPFDPEFLSWNPTIRITLWSGLIGTFVAFLARYGADQMVVQRYFTARSLGDAVAGFWWNVLAALAALVLLTLLGLALAVTPAPEGTPAMVRFAGFAQALPLGLTGVLAGGLLAATMSSVDSGLNSCLAVWMTDFAPRRPPRDPDRAPRQTGSLRPPAAGAPQSRRSYRTGIGLLLSVTIALAFVLGRTGDLFAVVNRVVNGVGSPLLALVLLGMFSRGCNATGAWVGGALGTAASLAISFGWDGLALHYYAVVNLLATLLVSLLASALTARRDPVTADQRKWTWRGRAAAKR